jgi:branched-chain amino acid transport system ATP-binding protein
MLNLENVTARYEENAAVLNNIDLQAKEGRITCVLGSNGAGKSTIVKTIVNLVKPRKGKITFAGLSIERMRTHQIIKQGISVVPESRQLFPKFTVKEVLRLGAYFVNNRKIIHSRMQKIFELFPILNERIDQLSGTLSGGELSILSLARALMSEPIMILLDEPSLGLAPVMNTHVFKAIKAINKNGITILLIEQNAKKSLDIASYGYLLQKGQIVAQGDAETLRNSELVKKAYFRG